LDSALGNLKTDPRGMKPRYSLIDLGALSPLNIFCLDPA